MKSKDVFGKALCDYYNLLKSKADLIKAENIITSTNISSEDVLPLSYLFRPFEEMPKIEQQALKLCKGCILDVGCGGVCHSLWLQKNGFQVKAIDISAGTVEVARKRGLKTVKLQDVMEVNERFDTVILLMNGTGIFKKVQSGRDVSLSP